MVRSRGRHESGGGRAGNPVEIFVSYPGVEDTARGTWTPRAFRARREIPYRRATVALLMPGVKMITGYSRRGTIDGRPGGEVVQRGDGIVFGEFVDPER